MFGFLCKNLVFRRNSARLELNFLRYPSVSSMLLLLRYVSCNKDEHSFTVSYLINYCGLSPKSALSASKHIHFKSLTKPDSVLAILKNYCFSETQISRLIKIYPKVLTFKPEKTLLPKLEFFHSKGFSSFDIADLISSRPYILTRSLNNHIIPTFNFINNLLRSDDKTMAAIKRCHLIFSSNFEEAVTRRINFLHDKGVSESNIVKLLYYSPSLFTMNFDKVKKAVEYIVDMGFDPLKSTFSDAVISFLSMSKPTWENKVDVYKRWNLSETEILAAFRKVPRFMTYSEDKIMATMDLFVSKLGWESSFVAKNPALVGFSLEKRLIPRASVLQLLVSKGLVDKDYRSANIFFYAEKKFLQQLVNHFDEAPELLKIYSEKLALSR